MSERSRADQAGQEPPSFLPSGKSQRSLRSNRPVAADPLSSSSRRSNQKASSQPVPTFAPTAEASNTQPRTTQSRRQHTQTRIAPALPTSGSAARRAGGRYHQGNSTPLQPARRLHTTAVAQRPPVAYNKQEHHARKILSTFLVGIIALIICSIGSAWFWTSKQLQHKDMLTNMASGTATSWLILGSDERDGTEGTGTTDDTPGFRTDTILVLTKPRHGNTSLISIPRDSLVTVNGQGMKINAAANIYGYRALTGQVEAISGHKIDHVVLIRFGGLEGVVQALGGVNLCYDQTVNDPYSGLNWTAGCHKADGGTALAFSRMRYADPKGDFGRAERQRMVIAAITHKAVSAKTLMNFSTLSRVSKASLGSITVDESTNPWTLVRMALAFQEASGGKGINGSVYWTDPDYYVSGLGSTVLLDDKRNLDLFAQLGDGSHEPGPVGGV